MFRPRQIAFTVFLTPSMLNMMSAHEPTWLIYHLGRILLHTDEKNILKDDKFNSSEHKKTMKTRQKNIYLKSSQNLLFL